jgi:hypothetical protein
MSSLIIQSNNNSYNNSAQANQNRCCNDPTRITAIVILAVVVDPLPFEMTVSVTVEPTVGATFANLLLEQPLPLQVRVVHYQTLQFHREEEQYQSLLLDYKVDYLILDLQSLGHWMKLNSTRKRQ